MSFLLHKQFFNLDYRLGLQYYLSTLSLKYVDFNILEYIIKFRYIR